MLLNKGLLYLKAHGLNVPVGIGKIISKLPFQYRPGIRANYIKQKRAIQEFSRLSPTKQEEYIFNRFKSIFDYSYHNIPFYNNLYNKNGLTPNDVRTYADIAKVPVIKKADLMRVPLEQRSVSDKNGLLVNTGGSSGKTLSFYMDPTRFGNEWAHIHHAWQKLGYSPGKLKLKFDGRVLVKDFIQYDFIRNSLLFDIYADISLVAKKLDEVSNHHKIYFLHGYPSAIYNFALHCRDHEPSLLAKLKKTLKGAFLVSEYPNPVYRELIEDVFEIETLSSYGHTETCVFAFEKNCKNLYHPMQTYGFAEAVQCDHGKYTLVGTNYFNYISPLIRYDTEDGISVPNPDENILSEFEITDGRSGEYILDKRHQKIPLTGLIFGRHHRIFNVCSHIQVSQTIPGQATILYVSEQIKDDDIKSGKLLDTNNVEIDFTYKKISNPVLTKSGKINLLVKEKCS